MMGVSFVLEIIGFGEVVLNNDNFSLQPKDQNEPIVRVRRGSIIRYVRDIIIVVVIGGIIVVLIFTLLVLAGLDAARDISSNLGDGVGFCFFDCGPELVIETGPILQTLKQQRWLEGSRETNYFPSLKAEKDRIGPLGSDSLSYKALVIVTAGVDLEFFNDDIWVEGSNLIIRLPPPQVRDCIIDEVNSEFYDGGCALLGIIPTGVCEELQIELRNQALVAGANANHDYLLDQSFKEAGETVKKLVGEIEGVEKVIIEKDSTLLSMFSENGTCISYQKEN